MWKMFKTHTLTHFRKLISVVNFKSIKVHILSKYFLVVAGAFVVFNLGIFLAYVDKTYPDTYINNNKLGKVKFSSIDNRLKLNIPSSPDATVNLGNNSVKTNIKEIGAEIDYGKVNNSIKKNRHWLPVANYFVDHQNHSKYELNKDKFNEFINNNQPKLSSPAVPAKIVKNENIFQISKETIGLEVDRTKSYDEVSKQINSGATNIQLSPHRVSPQSAKIDLESEVSRLNKILNKKFTIVYEGSQRSASATQIMSILQPNGETFTVADSNLANVVDALIASFGVRPANRSEIISTIRQAIANTANVEVVLQKAPDITLSYSYCVATKGVSEIYLGDLRAKLASVYADARGWGLDGRIRFNPTSGSCNFTVWLTEASLVPSFSPSVCDSTWSCRVGNNVIINFDRWSGASPAWNSAGGSLDDYRSMVINHETGHWFGFNHRFCGGSGQPAPVMQQQSINLQGCVFNPWPTSSEKQALMSTRGLN